MKLQAVFRLSSLMFACGALVACASGHAQTGVAADAVPEASSKAVEAYKQQQQQQTPQKQLTPEEQAQHAAVAERSRQRTAAVMKRDYALGHSFSTPGNRALYTVDHFRNQVSGLTAWKKADVIDVSCESQDKCRARVRVETISFAGGKQATSLVTHIDEAWLKENGEWFFAAYR